MWEHLGWVVVGAAISIGSLAVFVGLRRSRDGRGRPWSMRFLFSAKPEHLRHPTTLLICGGLLWLGAILVIYLS